MGQFPFRQWFQSLMQPNNPYLICCGEAGAFEADTLVEGDHYIAVITDGKGVTPRLGSQVNGRIGLILH
jgi:hypothetical protein